jgi:hypothetical protein
MKTITLPFAVLAIGTMLLVDRVPARAEVKAEADETR